MLSAAKSQLAGNHGWRGKNGMLESFDELRAGGGVMGKRELKYELPECTRMGRGESGI
jgi:hypothetical protein